MSIANLKSKTVILCCLALFAFIMAVIMPVLGQRWSRPMGSGSVSRTMRLREDGVLEVNCVALIAGPLCKINLHPDMPSAFICKNCIEGIQPPRPESSMFPWDR